MTSVSALENIHQKGLFGDYEGKNENELIKIFERKNLLIVQIAQYKNSSFSTKDINIDGLNLTNETLKVSCNDDTRILWCGPKNWLLISRKKDLLKKKNFCIVQFEQSINFFFQKFLLTRFHF